MKHRSFLPFACCSALLVVCLGFTIATLGQLPEQIAVHFSQQGTPDRWISSGAYSALILIAMSAFPIVIVCVFAVLPRLTGGRGQIPHPEYWLGPARAKDSFTFLFRHSCWLAAMTIAAVYGLHRLILQANTAAPPHLDMDRLMMLFTMFVVGLGWWLMAFLTRFSRQTT